MYYNIYVLLWPCIYKLPTKVKTIKGPAVIFYITCLCAWSDSGA